MSNNKKKIPFRLGRGPINLRDPEADTQLLIDEINRMKEEYGTRVRLVVIDTLSRALAGGDENSSVDMGLLVRCIDRIRNETGAAVALVHHSGKIQARGARGHSSLRCAIDTEIEIEDCGNKFPGIKVAKITKQRDYDYALPIHFGLKQIELGTTDTGKPIKSCVVISTADPGIAGEFNDESVERIKPNSRPGKALAVLEALITTKGQAAPKELGLPVGAQVVLTSEWQEQFFETHYKGKADSSKYEAFNFAKEKLSGIGRIRMRGGYVWIPE